ncbi:MAG: Mur ligase family protein [Bacteroidota bacterium]|nr:Mur ligase family protein [Bacteroidota bacterium]
MQSVHFIAIGGSAMHNLAIALQEKGFEVTGSDDEIFEPSQSRLSKHGLLPKQMGWFPEENIHERLDAIILGMHARSDNPELLKAKHLGLKIYSYPEYIYEQSKNKQRVVIAGSHGKTTITSMILHVMRNCKKPIDYLVGAQIEGFDNMVHLSDAPVIIIEGDEYLASPIDRVPKFLHYKHHMLVVSGIAWDHINVFPTFESYKFQFESLINATPKAGMLIYNDDDKTLAAICRPIKREDLIKVEYTEHKSKIKDGVTYLLNADEKYPVKFFGEHNLYNVKAAFEVCTRIGVSANEFYQAIQTFKGAANRLELLASKANTFIFKDFAHAPSKLDATTKAVAKQFPKNRIIACIELHTFSSLNKDFLGQYKNTLEKADVAIVYYNPETVAHKKLPPISEEEIKKAFNKAKLLVYTDSKLLASFIKSQDLKDSVLLLMSSGNFDGINLKEFANSLL